MVCRKSSIGHEAPSAVWYRYQAGRGFLQDSMDKERKPYIFVGLVCVREKYQRQGYMRKVLDIVFAEGDRLGVPVILETDAKNKFRCSVGVMLMLHRAFLRKNNI